MGLHTRHTLLLLLLLLGLAESRRRQRNPRQSSLGQCRALPRFRVNDVEPMALARGQITLVALLTSDCPFCLRQSERLQALKTELQSQGHGVNMMVVNGGPRPALGENGTFEQRVSFPVYHDDDDRTIWRQVFRGNKDDIFVFDRCGQLTYRIPFPYSYLGYNYVLRALTRTRDGNICPNCGSQDAGDLDLMMGDAPFSSQFRGRGHSRRSNHGRNRHMSALPNISEDRSRRRNRSGCPRSDPLCRDLNRARRRFRQYRRHHAVRMPSPHNVEGILELFQRSQRRSMGSAL
ncbi:hypothetical protein ACOMHN_013993 [Nucella lapillus]